MSMFEVTRVSAEVGDNEISFETGKLAKQADGAVVVRSGDTMILATAVGRQEARPDADFFPLTVDVEERMYAAGRIPGSFFRREGRPSTEAILACRLMDRPLRPAFPEGWIPARWTPQKWCSDRAASASTWRSSTPTRGPRTT